MERLMNKKVRFTFSSFIILFLILATFGSIIVFQQKQLNDLREQNQLQSEELVRVSESLNELYQLTNGLVDAVDEINNVISN